MNAATESLRFVRTEHARMSRAREELAWLLSRDPRVGPVLAGRRRLPSRVFDMPNPEWPAVYQAIPDALFFKAP